jgi:hypothetical protein
MHSPKLLPLSAAPALLLLAAAVAGLSIGQAARPDEATERLAADVKLLRGAGIEPDGPGLLDFYRRQTLSEAQRHGIRELIKQLGADSFAAREKATDKLIALGSAALPALRQSLTHPDLEVVVRAKKCLEAHNSRDMAKVSAAAARVLTARRPPQAVAVLLAFLADAGPAEEDTLVGVLTALGVRDGKADPALVAALTDKLPLRRAVAAEVLAHVGDARQRVLVRKLLTDAERAVRLHVAVALTYARDHEAVPALIDAVADSRAGQAREAQELLCRLAGAKAPRVKPGDEAAARKSYRDAWTAWWKEHGSRVDLVALDAGPPRKARVRARASATEKAECAADKPFDLIRPTTWAAGGYAPHWIEADLGASTQLASIRLVTSQLPDGQTTHEVWLSNDPIGEQRTRAKLAHTFKGHTKSNQRLKFDFPKGLAARYIQIRTTASPSWVAWGPIELYVGRTRSHFVREKDN